jgi:hypothetical protein
VSRSKKAIALGVLFGDGFALALPQATFHLVHQHAAAPVIGLRGLGVIQRLIVLLALGQNGQVVTQAMDRICLATMSATLARKIVLFFGLI